MFVHYQFVIFVCIIQSILFIGHWFLYRTLVHFLLITNPDTIVTLKFALGLLSMSFIPVSLLAFRYYNRLISLLYTVVASWLGIFNFSILAACFCWILYGIARILSLSLNQHLAEMLFGLAILVSLYGIINARIIRVTSTSIQLPNLPKQWKGKRAVWVSDTHLGQIRSYGFAKHITTMIQELHPDIVFIGGDLYDGVAMDLDKLTEPFSSIGAPQGTYFITGNHEEFSDSSKYLKAVRDAGMRVLNNEVVTLDGLQILGVDYRDSRNEQQFKTIFQRVVLNRNQPSILLKHSPDHIDIAQREGISLQLSGHTHQGQIFPFNYIASRIYHGYEFGLKQLGDLSVYVSSGAGTWGPPMRVGTRAEIVLIQFH
jgi:predicted MPP superfamily phosphohydrolase